MGKKNQPNDDETKSSSHPKYRLFSAICYLVAALMGLITAWLYMTSSKAMPYHLDALGVSDWGTLESGYQALMLVFMKTAGLGFLTVSVATLFFLVALLIRPDARLRLGLFVFSLVHISGMLGVVLYIRISTSGIPPIVPLCLALIMVITGYAVPLKKVQTTKPLVLSTN